jgi:hypothetical protein
MKIIRLEYSVFGETSSTSPLSLEAQFPPGPIPRICTLLVLADFCLEIRLVVLTLTWLVSVMNWKGANYVNPCRIVISEKKILNDVCERRCLMTKYNLFVPVHFSTETHSHI